MTPSPPPRVSVLMAVHNDARFVGETVASVLGQTMGDFEFVVVDDASTDGTAALLAGVGDGRLRVMRNGRNAGQVPSLNRGLSLCRGPVVARIDGDDVCEPGRLAAQLSRLDADPSLDGCATWTTEIDESGDAVGAQEPPGDPDHVAWSLGHTLRLYHPTMAVRRSAYERHGGYDESHRATEDYDLWCRLVAAGGRLGVVEERLVRYRRRAGQLSSVHAGHQRATAVETATAYLSATLGRTVDAGHVAAMRLLLSWDRPDAASIGGDALAGALRLMRDHRRAALGRASRRARALADAEVAGHLLRHGGRWLSASPRSALSMGRYIARLPGHRASGVGLMASAARCAVGRR